MEAIAKQVTQCDNCKHTLRKEDDIDGNNIQAKLGDSLGKLKDYHFCDEECLRMHLNGRSKRKSSKASIEIDFTEAAILFKKNKD